MQVSFDHERHNKILSQISTLLNDSVMKPSPKGFTYAELEKLCAIWGKVDALGQELSQCVSTVNNR